MSQIEQLSIWLLGQKTTRQVDPVTMHILETVFQHRPSS